MAIQSSDGKTSAAPLSDISLEILRDVNAPAFRPLYLGTRASPLALAQAEEVKAKLIAAHGLSETAIEIVKMATTGDNIQDRALSEIGGKGLFTKELEQGLYEGALDFAVHSMKDVATVLPDGMDISTILPREVTNDAFVSLKYRSIDELPEGAVFGTSSLRRRAQLLALRPDLRMVEFRGNVGTRLQKLADNVAEATFLASAGLRRLHRQDLFDEGIANELPEHQMLPAAAQGAIGIEQFASREALREILAPLHCEETAICVKTERAFLARLEGSCRTPIAAQARMNTGVITLRGEVLSLDGQMRFVGEWQGEEPNALGVLAADDLLAQGAASCLAGI